MSVPFIFSVIIGSSVNFLSIYNQMLSKVKLHPANIFTSRDFPGWSYHPPIPFPSPGHQRWSYRHTSTIHIHRLSKVKLSSYQYHSDPKVINGEVIILPIPIPSRSYQRWSYHHTNTIHIQGLSEVKLSSYQYHSHPECIKGEAIIIPILFHSHSEVIKGEAIIIPLPITFEG